MPKRPLSLTAIAVAAALASAGAWALGFGPVRAAPTMGQPLDASVVVRLQPGETLSDNCVSAVVSSGDTQLAPGQVTTSFVQPPGAEPRVRVRTSVGIDEPFVNMLVTIGCESPVARQFTVFVDPPPVAVALEPRAAPGLPFSGSSRPDAADSGSSVVAGGAVRAPRSAGRRSEGLVQRQARPRGDAVVAVNRSRAAAVADEPAIPSSPLPDRAERNSTRMASGVIARSEGVARLRLDSAVIGTQQTETPLVRATQQREEALQTAKIAVDVAEAANTSAAQKIAKMEEQLAAARKEVADAQAALKRVQAQQAAAAASAAAMAASVDSEDWLSGYTTVLAAGCGILLLVSGGLFWRLRRSDAERLQGWMKDNSSFTRLSEFDTVAPVTEQFSELEQTTLSPGLSAQPVAAPSDATSRGHAAVPSPQRVFMDSRRGGLPAQAEPIRAAVAPVQRPPAPAPMPASAPMGRQPQGFTETQPSTTMELDHSQNQPDISIEELLDVEQQAEFFVVLGQDDAAIDLLTNHVMTTGGASPMPYLKLLEIYRRIGDQTSYERTRKRFNARFNGVAPEWGADPNAGRTLLEYPDVIRRIESSWSEPVDAMADLQTLMFRNDSNLLFELPAYRDIMLLFTVARDLHEASADDQAAVDVLLPLNLPSSGAVPASVSVPEATDFGGLRLVLDEPPAAATAGRR
jgi:pilus assembly protein FimV